MWDGWEVRRYTPEGTLDRRVRLPVSRPTSCAFGGSGLSDLYVTSARGGLTDGQHADQPLAGGLFVVRSGTSGYAATPFDGSVRVSDPAAPGAAALLADDRHPDRSLPGAHRRRSPPK